MKLNLNNVAVVAAILLGVSSLLVGVFYKNSKTIYYLDNMELMKEFKMTKEMESKFHGVSAKRQEIVDSMKLGLDIMEKKIRTGQKELLDEYRNKVIDYRAIYEKFEKDNQEVTTQFNEEVLKQLNQYIKEYGQEKKIDFIMGANGTGTLLYASEKNDITKDVIKYVNLKYIGKK